MPSLEAHPKLKVAVGLLFFLVGFLSGIALAGGAHVEAHGGRNDECEDALNVTSGTDDLRSYTDTNGNIVTGVCIKAGNDMFDDGHSDSLGNDSYLSGCYTVTGVGTVTVTVTRNFGGNSCKALSHIDVYLSPQQEPTPSPSPSPTPTPSDQPTPTPSPTPSPTPTTEPSPTPSPTSTPAPTPTTTPAPTPTPTSTPAPTPTPTPGGQVAGTSTSDDSDDPSDPSDPAPQGQVLGASTLAATGSFGNALIILGLLLAALPPYGYLTRKIRGT